MPAAQTPRQIPIYRGGTWSHPPSTSKTGYPGWDNPFLVRVFLWDFWKRCTIPALFGIEPVPVSSTSLRDASEAGGTLPRAKNSPPDCFYGSLRCRRPFESRPEYQKTRYPNGYLVFWYECSYRTFAKDAPYRRFSASNLFRFHPHPYGMRLKPEGLSHGLKTVHRTVFTAACAAAALSSPARSIKKPDTRMGIWFFGTPEGTRTPNPRNRNPMLYPLSHRRIP